MLRSYSSTLLVTHANRRRKFFAINLAITENKCKMYYTAPAERSHTALLQANMWRLALSAKRTGTQRRTNHDTCIVRTVVGERAHLSMK